jgi:response regulator RpfG family c-di-GMP phosphodiesterase
VGVLPAGSPTRVLYVDDEAPLCRAFARLFGRQEGVEVATSTSAPEALRLIDSAPFDVIVSDLRMPEMDGLQLLAEARTRRPEARRFLVSGHADLETAVMAVNRLGVDRLLTKPWDASEMVATIRAAASHVALLRENARVQQDLRAKTRDLRRLNRHLDATVAERTRAILESLSAALDKRDSETQWHSLRVGCYARRLGAELGIAGSELDEIEHGSVLHDIGKIGVRDAVLLKDGPLDDNEWVEMRRHPALGHEILKGIGFLEQARLIPLQHQEKWDGTGYPARLRGEQICIGARIFAVVDTYDAITSDRPYRKARPYEFARTEIERGRGTQFDPSVVEAWARVPVRSWQDIRARVEGGG